MRIKVKLFANLREKIGYDEKEIEISDGTTLNEVWMRVAENSDWRDEILMAVNMDYANPDTLVKDGDEVAFFPPVTGG
jgi:molybdopterin synthase sulfur carrier subunit